MFLLQNALKNIVRQRGRYRVLAPLLLVSALLAGFLLTVAVPCRSLADGGEAVSEASFDEPAENAAAEERIGRARKTGESASLLLFGVMLVGAVSVFYVSSLMIGERMYEIGILCAVGLSRGQIFFTMFLELFAVSAASAGCGLAAGRLLGGAYLRREAEALRLPAEILTRMGGGRAEILCLLAVLGILLIPLVRLTVRLLGTNPTALLARRK